MAELAASLSGNGGPSWVSAAMAHLNLVMIHPFRDGNGRMARCLQSLVLACGGLLSPVFLSIEEYLGRNTQQYCDVLGNVGQGSWQPGNDTGPWIRFILTAHLRQARTMLVRVREAERLWISLDRLAGRHAVPERVIPVMFDAAMGLRVRNATYRAGLAESGETVTAQTAQWDLQRLVTAGLLVTSGENRGRVYLGGEELLRLRQEIAAARDPGDDSDPFAG
jgi:Fic family protein